MKKIVYLIFILQAFIFNLTNVITPDYLNGLDLPKYMFGYYSAIWSLGMLVSSPFWGKYASQYGRKKMVLVGVFIYGVTQLGFYYTRNIYLLSLLRLLSGVGVGAIVTLLLSYLILNTDRDKRAKALSYRLAFITLGSTISYQVSGYLGLRLTEELFLYQSVLSIGLFLMVLFFVRENNNCVFPKQFHLFQSVKNIKKLDKRLLIFLLSVTLTTMTFVNLDKFIDLYVIDLGYKETMVGNIKTVYGIVLIVTNFLIVPKFKRFLGHVYILQTIQIIMSIIVLVTFMEEAIVIALYSMFLGFVVLKGIYQTSEQVYLSKIIEKEDMNVFIGIRQSFTCLGMILGPIIGGHIYAHNTLNLFLFNVVCLLLSSVLISYMRYVPRKEEELQYSNI